LTRQPTPVLVFPIEAVIGTIAGIVGAIILSAGIGFGVNSYILDKKTRKYATLDHLANELSATFKKGPANFNEGLSPWIAPWQSKLSHAELQEYEEKYGEITDQMREKGKDKMTFKSDNEIQIAKLILETQRDYCKNIQSSEEIKVEEQSSNS